MLKEVLGPRMMQKLMQRRQAEEVSAAGKRIGFSMESLQKVLRFRVMQKLIQRRQAGKLHRYAAA
jgi:hypothetical protein